MGLFSKAAPPLTEKNLPDQSGKVFTVTSRTGGLGHHLVKMLYAQNAKVWIAAHSGEKATKIMDQIKAIHPSSRGALLYLQLELNDLKTIKASAEKLITQENSLHVLWNNVVPTPLHKAPYTAAEEKAKISPPGAVRVVWVSSSAAKNFALEGGLDVANLDYHGEKGV
ncbi:uncharacterized protein RSE6_07460 [Rhynchosporium secalis]|uniref:NAD(P)-binding protein n=1 Tax=Rhynchosporium secalis TaxID=38038 RepID=A0A1E1MCV9_RHYSE|nr:uncharacterized protein RSE6_07460 [Rhynchosporium secalis]